MEIHPEIKRLNEAGLSRVWQAARDRNRDFMIASADIADDLNPIPIETLKKRRESLIAEVRSLGLGFASLMGRYTMLDGRSVQEASFFISGPRSVETSAKLDSLTQFIFRTLGQECVARKIPEGVELRYADGKKINIGEFTPDKLADNCSVLVKGSHAGRSFTFESSDIRSWGEAIFREKVAHGASISY